MRYEFDNMLTLSDVAENPNEYIRNKAIGFNSIIIKFNPLYLAGNQYCRIKIPRMMVFNKTTGLYDIVIFTSNVKPQTDLDMLADRPFTFSHPLESPLIESDDGILKSIYQGE